MLHFLADNKTRVFASCQTKEEEGSKNTVGYNNFKTMQDFAKPVCVWF